MLDYERIVNRLTTMVETTARMEPGEINEFENLIELGADSMILTDVNGLIREEFGVEIPMTLFFSDLTSIREIADYIYQQQEASSPVVSQEEVVEEQAETEEIEPIENQQRQTVMDEVWAAKEQFSSAPVSSSDNGLQQLFSQQLAVINQQLQLLSPQQEVAATVVKAPDPVAQDRNEPKPSSASPRSVVEKPEKRVETKQKSYVPFQKLNLARKDKDPKQEQQLQELIQKYNQKTPSSKQYAENYRNVYADWRNIAGFKPNIKEMVYQLVFEDSKGSRITDIDGNEYIDLAMDFGVSLFGHNPDFIKNAIVEETAQGFPLSLISRLSGEVAQLISEMTGVERVSFFNSGTEAVMVAIRLARAITGKDKIVIFSGSYHGTFDGVLGMDAMSKEKGAASPIAGGILQSYIDGLYVLEYGHPESLAFIEEHRDEIAGVLVEPVQSRRPDLQPREFLHQLRDVTLKTGIQLIFDEMILGFRLGPGGAQQFFNVEADLVTYGKIVGGGMPIGIVAGKHEVMDCLDGGMWHYGDESTPPFENKRTFAGGTFCHHPLTMAAAKAVLLKIKEESHDIYPALAAKTKYLADTLNEFFQEHEVPAEIVYCESLFRFVLRGNMELFYYHLLSEGVYIWEGRNCFLSAAHTDDDIEDVIRIVKETCLKMKTVFFAKKSEDSKKNNKVPLTHQQQEMLASEVVHPSTSAFNQPVLLNIQGTLDRQALEQALRSISKRHEALRYTVSDDLECLKVGEPAKLDLTELEVRSEEEQEVISDCIHTSLDVQNGPLIKVFLLQPPDQQEQTKLLVIAHHLIMDGWSISVFCEELIEAYNSQLQNRAPSFREVLPYSEYRRQRENVLQSIDEEKIKSFWREYLPSYPTRLRLPQRDPLTMSEHNKEGSRFTYRLDAAFLKKIRKLAANVKSSPFLVLLTTYQFMLREISQQNDFMIGVPIAGQQACATRSLIGDCVSMVPLHVQLNQDSNMATAVAKNQAIFQKFEKMHHATLYDFTGNEDFVQPELTILFNMDRMPKNNHFLGTETELLPIQVQNVGYDLFFNLTEFQGEIIFDIDFNTNKISEAMVTRWMQLYIDLLEQICNQPGFSLYELDVYSEEDEKIRKQAIEQGNWDELSKTLQINEQDMEINAANFTAYVLSEEGKPVPTNSYGLLYIGSDRLALYPTGWIARFTANRELELFGPEERCFYEGKTFVSLWLVEQVIRKHPDICEVTVKRTRDQQSLEAYITWATDEGAKSDLPKWCQSKLPFAFIPHRFYQEVGDGQAAILLEFTNEALNHEEQIVFDIVKDLIGNGHFHKDDHLMSLGMNSLNLLKLISTLQEVYDGIRIPMSMLVEELTVENIAKTIHALGEEGQAEAIPQIASAAHYETSAPQQRMYVIHTLNKESLNYNLPSVVKVAGEFDIEKFKAAANACLQRHEILRTTYEQVDGEIVQIVNEQVELPVDFKEITTEVAEGELIQQMTAEFVRPFDLQKAPLMRMKIVKRSEQLHYIFFDFHHISFDGSSALIFAEEMMSAYQDKVLAPLPIQYKDFAHWQNKQEQSEEMKSQQQYWQELLQTASLNCGFPTDFTRPLERTYAGNTIEYQLDQKLKARITDFCRERECTPYSFFLSTLNILVSIYSGQADVTIGTLVHGRNHRDIEGLIGMFVNTLPMVHSVPSEQTYDEYVKHVQKSVMQTFAHADVPFDQIVELAGTKNDIGRNPLFDVMFSYQDFDQLSIHTDQATFEYQDLLPDDSKFDTEFEVIDQEEGYTITLQYATELYREASIQRILQHFVTLIDKVLSNPTANLTEYQILTKQERQELLQFNNQDHSYSEKTIIDLFENWAVKTPDKIAVVDEEHELTYQQLNEQANHIARLYMNLGLEEEDVVGIMLERSLQMISSVVGAWKAGGAYLPLDLAHPMQRRIDILHEANVKFVVTLSEYVEDEFREAYKGKIIYLDQIEQDLSHSCENLGKQVSPTNLAYILFTSGSTGKPKGVMIEHQGMLNHILAEQNDLKLDDKLVFAQNANQTFDISVWQLFGPLALGGKTVIYAQQIVLEPEKFVQKIAADQITLLEIVPSYLTVMLDELETQKYSFPSLQSLIITGETVPPHLVERWFQSYPDIEVINAYGPAEASDDVSQYRLSTMADGLSRVPIGQPLRNVRIYVLDKYNRLCPPGVAGELCVAGIAVGRGYVNSPEKTRQVFCEDPFTERKTERERRMYRTGDLARWLPNGQLEYLGRMDNQVKIRGFRIEPGEIEAVIRKQIGIQEVAVVAKKDHADDLSLCAYLVANETSEIEKDHLKAAIRKELPEYMVPDHFMMLEQLPVTSNGKLDQKRLPDPQFDRETSILEPRSETERVLVGIYQDVLGVKQISVDDHFFEQGGHSLKATKVMNQIEVRLGIRLPLKTIFTHPTVEQLGQQIELHPTDADTQPIT
ncbi:non-ribosomal peptide synthetase, partial [Bacillus sp. SD088]|uniref:non-ribosomal peptide synthetase n=1 Tax=Bacillus sp. SD088 TaxID=2782012 RepID=UPI001A96C1B3